MCSVAALSGNVKRHTDSRGMLDMLDMSDILVYKGVQGGHGIM